MRDRASERHYAIKTFSKLQLTASPGGGRGGGGRGGGYGGEVERRITNVLTEKQTMLELAGHPFVLTLHATYHERESLHMLLELALGGELFRLMSFETLGEDAARFYVASLTLALQVSSPAVCEQPRRV